MNDRLKQFGDLINRLIAGKSLSREEVRQAVMQILKDATTEIHQGAFLAAVTAKGPTPDEIAGAWQAIYEEDTTRADPQTETPVLDNCGTGMDGFKTFNISTAAAVVAAAGGVPLARHGARAITSRCGTVDLCEAVGVDVECPVPAVTASIERVGIGLYNGMSPFVHPRALFRILSRMSFGSILNIAASLANPARPRLGVRGVYAGDMAMPVAQVMREIGYRKAIVLHGSAAEGVGGMDELTPVGDNLAAELMPDGQIRSYTIAPAAVGVRFNGSIRDIAAGPDPQTEALRLIRVFAGKDHGALFETICLNTAPIFYLADNTEDLKSGFEKARELIQGGQALKRLRQWVKAQNTAPEAGAKRFDDLANLVENET
ncbi:MAG: anthranilate phosphoribosyltransferase [Thermodesulfobacteriota bacterium]